MQKWVILIALSLGFCAAQTSANKAPEPEPMGVLFYLDPSTQILKELPRADSTNHRRLGLTGDAQMVVLKGAASSFRIVEGRPTFIFQPLLEERAHHYILMPCTIHKDKREYQTGKWERGTLKPMRSIDVTISKYGESSYKLTPDRPLMPGEYALQTKDKIFSFGIEAPGK